MRTTSSPVLAQLGVTIGPLLAFSRFRPAEPRWSFAFAIALGLGFAVLSRLVDAFFSGKALDLRRYLLLGLVWAVLASGIVALEAATGRALWQPLQDLLLFVPLALWVWWQPQNKGEQQADQADEKS